MSKAAKRGKSAQGGAAGAKWEQGLLAATFEEEKWKANIAFVVGRKAEDYTWINILGSAVAAGSRRLYSTFSKDELYSEVRELGNPKGKKPKEVPQHYEVCEPCKTHLDAGEEIPLHLLAKLLKFKFLAIKANDFKRRENEKKLAAEKEKAKAKAAEKAAGGGGKERAKSPGKGKGGGKKTPEPQQAKDGSKLRKRGEEDPDGKYIDDEPDDGASHYIIVHGFHQPHLFGLLAELGISVSSVIRINSQDYSRFIPAQTDEQPSEKDEKTIVSRKSKSEKESLEAAEEAAREEKNRLKKELKQFWKDLAPILQKQSSLHDIARKDYEVKELLIPQDLEDQEQKTQFGTSLFEDIACMIYDLIDAKRQWQNYVENIKLIHVPQYGLPTSTAPPGGDGEKSGAVSGAHTPAAGQPVAGSVPSLQLGDIETPQVDMRYYNDLMNCVPQESVSVPLVLHCMLEQVVATKEEIEPPSEQQPAKRSDGINPDLANHLSKVAFKLALTEEEHNALAEVLSMPERPPEEFKQPLLMNCHDDVTQRTQHLKPIHGFNPEKTEEDMLQKLPFRAMFDFPQPTSQVAKERAARLQELIHFCATGGLSQSEIDRAFKQFVFECMDLAGTDSNGFIITRDSEGLEHSAIPWDDPYPFFKGMIPHHEKEDIRLTPVSDERSGAESEIFNSISTSTPSSSVSNLEENILPPTPLAPRGEEKILKRPDSAKGKRGRKKDKRAQSPALATGQKPPTPIEACKDEKGNDGSRPGSADSKKGILRPASRSSSREGRRSRSPSARLFGRQSCVSVHFEEKEGHTIGHVVDDEKGEEEEILGGKTTEESMNEIVDAQKRMLDQWCFAEHYEPKVLLQVLKNAMYDLPFVDTYYHKRDHSLMVVLHNPHNTEFQNHVDWHTELHSNLGFRNYLDYVEESVRDWTTEEEAKYQAHLLSKEIQRMREEEEMASRAAEKRNKSAAKRGSKETPKAPKGRSKSPKSPRGSSQERPSSAGENFFIREGSLKAWKMEQDKIKAEDDERERQRSAKRSRSPKKKEEKEEKDGKKRASPRGSAKSKVSGKEADQEPAMDGEPIPDEKYWPFTGYDVGNNIIHVSGITSTLFPSDGGQIRMERTDYTQGSTYIKTSVLKDNHTFTVHVIDPKDSSLDESQLEGDEDEREGAEKSEFERPEKDNKDDIHDDKQSHVTSLKSGSQKMSTQSQTAISAYGSITAQMSDGMTIALSQFGETGSAPGGKKYEPEPYLPPVTDASPVPPPSPSKGKKGDKGDKTDRKSEKGSATPEPQELEEKDEVKSEEPVIDQPFQQLFISCPDGLNVKYMLESHVGMKPMAEDDRRLLVKQSYPYKTNGTQQCETLRKKYALTEVSRFITSEGTVVKNMMDGSIQVLYADGTVSVHTGHWETSHSRDSSPQRGGSAKSQDNKPDSAAVKRGDKSDRSKKGKQHVELVADPVEEEKKSVWVTTLPNGDRMQYKDNTAEELKPIMICLASDPETNQSMATRDDHVMTVSYADGTTIVEHADGTRITTYYRESQVPVGDSSTEDTGDTEKEYEVQTNKFVKVECPAFATVEFNCMTSENLTIFGNGTTVNIFPDGYYMLHHYDGGRLEVDTEAVITYFPRPYKGMEQLLPERESRYLFCHNADVIVETVDADGNVFNVKSNGDFSVIPVDPDNISDVSSDDPLKGENKKIHVYKEHAPRFFIIHSDGSGTELLRYQDIAEYLTSAEQSPATAVLRDELPDFPGVLGITILKPYLGGPSEKWLKKYDQESIIPPGIRCRDLTTLPPKEFKTPGPKFGTNVGQGLSVGAAVKPQLRIPILKCPSVLELRQFIQYKPMSEDLRGLMQKGLREYAEYVLARNEMSKFMQVVDPRTEEEKINASDLQSLAQANNELVDYEKADVKAIYEKALSQPEPSPPPTPTPKRSKADWERDERELAEEMEGLEALRTKKIPKYFDSEFGKAFLLTQAKDFNESITFLSEDPRKDGTEAIRRGETFDSKEKTEPPTSAPGMPPRSTAAVTSQSDRSSHSDLQPKLPASEEMPMPKVAGADTPMSFAVYSEVGHSASGMRPGNPTPAHATGQGSPAPVRPQAPTPAHAQKLQAGRPVNPTPKQAGAGTESPSDLPSHLDYPIILEQPTLEEEHELSAEQEMMLTTESFKMDVLGQPRKQPVPLPAVIKGGRPGAIPNTKFVQVEDPVRRKINNSLTAGATIKGQTQLQAMRGMYLLPEEVDFGVLKEGNTYAFTVYLKNTGVDTCRFKLKQPPPATGLRVIYKPGPIAAGMKADLNIELYAIAVGVEIAAGMKADLNIELYAIAVGVEGETGVGSIRHDLEIVTETDVLFLPVSATVLTAYEFDNRSANSPRGGKSPGARLVSTKPPATTGIIRPRKNITLEPVK